MITALVEIISPIVITVWDTAKFYLFWTTMHFVAINLYQKYCAEWSIWGYITSSIYSQYPHCRGLKWVYDISITTLDHYWMLVMASVISNFTGLFKGKKKE
jgi:hypothetical protein